MELDQVVLGQEDVHVWHADISQVENIEAYQGLLASSESKRAGRFFSKRDHERYILSRGILRILIGHYLRSEPGRLSISCGPYGKPVLKGGSLKFNLSHSGDRIVYGFTRDRNIGVDIEKIRYDLNAQKIAERFLAPWETALLNVSPDDRKIESFFALWTRKEAYLKGTGLGFFPSLEGFDDGGWTVKELRSIPPYIAAIAVQGSNWNLSCWEWKPSKN